MNLRPAFESAFPDGWALELAPKDDALEIGTPGAPGVLKIYPYFGEWVVGTAEGHAHFETPEQACEVAAQVLTGEAIFASEYRSETLSATWMEIRREGVFEAEHMAIFLCPFDADDWELWPGEQWRQVRVSRTYLPEAGTIAESVKERFAQESAAKNMQLLDMLPNALGPPESGMLWTVGMHSRFIFQHPAGWRRRLKSADEAEWIDFFPQAKGLVFRAYNYFRDVENPILPPISEAVGPLSLSYKLGNSDPIWVQHTWSLHFSDGESEMMGILDLFHLSGMEEVAEPYRTAIEVAAPMSVFVPERWNINRAP